MIQPKQTRTTEECILSNNNIQKTGYDRVQFKGKSWLAHRLAYTISHGPIPKGKLVLHHCDVRNCVRPKHLYAGTYKDNMKDCLERGHHPKLNKKFCPKGHPYSGKNLIINEGHRRCRICSRYSTMLSHRKMRAK